MGKIQPTKDAVTRNWQALSTRQTRFIVLISIITLVTLYFYSVGWAIGALVVLLFALAITYVGLKVTWPLVGWTVLLVALVAIALPNFYRPHN